MIAYLLGNADIGREIRIISVGCESIGIARFTYQMREVRIFGFGGGERMYLVVQVEVGNRINGRIRISVVDAASCFLVAVLADVERVGRTVIFGEILRPLDERGFQFAGYDQPCLRDTGDRCDIGIQRVSALAVGGRG